MSEQPIDLRESAAIVRRRWLTVAFVVMLGLGGGAYYGVHNFPESRAAGKVLLPPQTASGAATTAQDTKTQAIIATSSSVLSPAAASVSPPIPVRQLEHLVSASVESTVILRIEARAPSAGRAVQLVAAVTGEYQKYVKDHNAVDGPTTVIEPAAALTPPSRLSLILKDALLGLLAGLLVGVVIVLVRAHRDHRLRRRDQIARAIGAPVLASMEARRYKSVSDWIRLLERFDPSAMNAWTLRSVLRSLVPSDLEEQLSIQVISLVGDKAALATGPELALFAAASGIPTRLAPGDHPALEPLSAACAAARAAISPEHLLTFDRKAFSTSAVIGTAGDPLPGARHGPAVGPEPTEPHLVVSVVPVDPTSPELAPATGPTILAVSSGFALIDDLARVELASAKVGLGIDGIVVVNPDPTDSTSGAVPDPKPAARRAPISNGPSAGASTRIAGRSRWRA